MKKIFNELPFFTRFCPPPKCKVGFFKPSLTQQQFKQEADINNIIASVNASGALGNPLWTGNRTPVYGDFSDIQEGDYLRAQNILLQADEDFMQLPAKVRQRFNNNPAELLAFIENNPNSEELVKLGLATKKTAEDVKPEKDMAEPRQNE